MTSSWPKKNQAGIKSRDDDQERDTRGKNLKKLMDSGLKGVYQVYYRPRSKES